MAQAFVTLELYQAAQSRIATLEAALIPFAEVGRAIKTLNIGSNNKEHDLAYVAAYEAIAKGEKHETE